MYKVLAITIALFVATQAFSLGGQQEQVAVTDQVMEIARWTTSQLSAYTNVEGTHTIMTVRNLKTQVVAGINYRFTLDVIAQTEDNKYFFKSCEIAVFDQPWTNTRQFIEAPKCGNHPNFQ